MMMRICGANAASTGTVFDTDTKLMLHMNGADASTTFTDSSSVPKTVTANDNAQIDTAQSKFGGASGLFDGTSDNLTIPNSADFQVGAGDFTIDFWVRWNGSVSNTIFFDMNDFLFSLRWSQTNTRWEPYMNGEPFGASGTDTLSENTWYHIAFVRSGSTVYLFRDGTLIHSGTNSQNLTPNGTFYLGSIGSGSESMNGWIDEFRFVKGTAVWTANFTPPTAEYSDPSGFTPKITWFS